MLQCLWRKKLSNLLQNLSKGSLPVSVPSLSGLRPRVFLLQDLQESILHLLQELQKARLWNLLSEVLQEQPSLPVL